MQEAITKVLFISQFFYVFSSCINNFLFVETKVDNKWNDEATSILLKKYYEFFPNVGPKKKFRNLQAMWQRIASELNNLGYDKSAEQCNSI
jgi:hypothetical protein